MRTIDEQDTMVRIHASDDMDSRVLTSVPASLFGAELGARLNACGCWGAHVDGEGRVHVIVEGGDEPEPTEVFVDGRTVASSMELIEATSRPGDRRRYVLIQEGEGVMIYEFYRDLTGEEYQGDAIEFVAKA